MKTGSAWRAASRRTTSRRASAQALRCDSGKLAWLVSGIGPIAGCHAQGIQRPGNDPALRALQIDESARMMKQSRAKC
jgi:hypothetical protein